MPTVRRYHFLGLLWPALAFGTVACQSDTATDDVLSGYWSADTSHLSASGQGASLVEPCLAAQFAPITVDSSGSFSVTSTTLTETGNTIHYPDDELHLQGRLQGGTLALTLYVVRSEPPVNDPIAITMTAGGSHDTPVCPA